jgi:hypothetical protein
MSTNTPDLNQIVKQRLERGDFQPLIEACENRMNAEDVLLIQGRDPSLMDGIPANFFHPVIQDFMAGHGWDLATIPAALVEELAEKIRQMVIAVLTVPPPPETDKPAWAVEDLQSPDPSTPEGLRNLLYHGVIRYNGWAETLEALADIAGVDGPDPELVLRLQMLATAAKDNRW